jgi:hypothetical protein
MATTFGKQLGVGLRSATVFELDAAGLPAAVGTSAYEGFTVVGPKAYTLEIPAVRKIVFPGNDRVLALDFLPAIEASSAELRTSADDIPLNAFLTGVDSYAVGEATAMNYQTDQQGNEPDVAMLMFQQSLDTSLHLRNYRFHILPKTRAIPAPSGMDENAGESKYALAPNPSTKHLWGETITVGSQGSTEVTVVNGMAKGRPKVVAFKGDGITVAFLLPVSKPATAIAKIATWVAGVLKAGGGGDYVATTTSVTFNVAPALDTIIVVFYEY